MRTVHAKEVLALAQTDTLKFVYDSYCEYSDRNFFRKLDLVIYLTISATLEKNTDLKQPSASSS